MQCPNEGGDNPLRIGIVDYLNSRPLAWSFLSGRSVEGVEAHFLSPAGVAELLAAGELDVGLIPTIELQRVEGLSVIPDLCVAATQEVRSVLLLSRVEPESIRRLALDENSRTSVALVRILLRDLYGVEPETVTAAPDVSKMLENADAALLIGDPALIVDRARYRVLDLAGEWRRLTGKPFVFAVWAVRDGVDLVNKFDLFQLSLDRGLDRGLENVDQLADDAATEQSLAEEEVRAYLTKNLSYRLNREELSGLHEFFERAFDHGLIPSPGPLRFARSCGTGGDSIEYVL
jgi:chorismate dehydratase